tara:strand:+ start:2178 stop:2345 length:168 start_codon:yes stop_codon:yes gene_type:complete
MEKKERKTNQIPLMLSDGEVEKVQEEANKMMGSRNQIIRIAIKEYFEKKENDTTT